MEAKRKSFYGIMASELRRAMGGMFFISIIFVMICIALDSWDDFLMMITNKMLPGTTSAFYFFWNAVIFGGVYSDYFIPMMAALPYASSYTKEYQSGMTPFIVARSGKINYYSSKIMISAVSGGMAAALGTTIFVLLLTIKLSFVNDAILLEMVDLPWYSLLRTGNGELYIIIIFLRAFLSGAMWASIAMAVSAYVPNIYVTIASPFIGKFLLIRVYNLIGIPVKSRLDFWLSGRFQPGTDGISLLITSVTVIIIIFICGAIFTRKGIRRLENGLFE